MNRLEAILQQLENGRDWRAAVAEMDDKMDSDTVIELTLEELLTVLDQIGDIALRQALACLASDQESQKYWGGEE